MNVNIPKNIMHYTQMHKESFLAAEKKFTGKDIPKNHEAEDE